MPPIEPAQPLEVTNPAHPGTNAGARVMAALRAWRVPLALGGVWMAIQATVNSVSVANDMARRGVAFRPAEPWVWEFSSVFGIALWLLPLLVADDRLRARFASPWRRIAPYVLLSVVFSALHVATMVGVRQAIYAVAGWAYDFGPWLDGLLYEYRKDVLTFIIILAVAAVWRRLRTRDTAVAAPAAVPDPAPAASPVAPSAEPSAAPTFIVRTATQGDLLVRADEIDWVEAQGNYVALHVGSEVRLLRQTLAETEARLKDHGFIRTHRRALVNKARMQSIMTPPRGSEGEPGVRLASGEIAPLSESRRAEVLRLVAGD
ncbi:MAG: LytTR family DNA-binding domain-containing protein [Burkholderiaceae bacterium]